MTLKAFLTDPIKTVSSSQSIISYKKSSEPQIELEETWETMALLIDRVGAFTASCGGTDLRKGFTSYAGSNEMFSTVLDV